MNRAGSNSLRKRRFKRGLEVSCGTGQAKRRQADKPLAPRSTRIETANTVRNSSGTSNATDKAQGQLPVTHRAARGSDAAAPDPCDTTTVAPLSPTSSAPCDGCEDDEDQSHAHHPSASGSTVLPHTGNSGVAGGCGGTSASTPCDCIAAQQVSTSAAAIEHTAQSYSSSASAGSAVFDVPYLPAMYAAGTQSVSEAADASAFAGGCAADATGTGAGAVDAARLHVKSNAPTMQQLLGLPGICEYEAGRVDVGRVPDAHPDARAEVSCAASKAKNHRVKSPYHAAREQVTAEVEKIRRQIDAAVESDATRTWRLLVARVAQWRELRTGGSSSAGREGSCRDVLPASVEEVGEALVICGMADTSRIYP